ncbi:MAG: DUF362 domain-containing protein [Chloroflexi bacterium]|nr:DUF362 domain-containing protein [Chloroflexota bacterium]
MPGTVALLRCTTYNTQEVEAVVRSAVGLLGGMSAFVKPGWRVILKPNILRAATPDSAIITHPAVVRAVAILVREAGATPILAESPAGPFNKAVLRLAYTRGGYDKVAEEVGMELNYDVTAVQVSHPEGHLIKRLDILKAVDEADAVIALPKFKTHNLTRITGATKILFGVVPGVTKFGYHAKLQDAMRFSEALVDIITYVKPVLTVMDAIVGMHGNGPSGGDPYPANLLLASADPFAMDVVCATLVGMEPLSIPPLKVAAARGLTSCSVDDVPVVGLPLAEARLSGFRYGTATTMDTGIFPRAMRRLGRRILAARTVDGKPACDTEDYAALDVGTAPRAIRSWVTRQVVANPQATDRCIGCGVCVRSCPVQAISLVNGRAHMDWNKCIRCYCCHEVCPENAVELRRSLIGRLMSLGSE